MTKDKLFEEELARRNPDWKKIVAVHNAAIRHLEKQLAAEREKCADLEREIYKERSNYASLHKQLAAERSKSELAEFQWKEVSKQLAAAIEALKEVHSLLTPPNHKIQIIDAALAKVSNCNEK